jgi:hypothetical protein
MLLTDKRDPLSAFRKSHLCGKVSPDSFSITNEDGAITGKGGKPKPRTTMLYAHIEGEYLAVAAFLGENGKGLLLNVMHHPQDVSLPRTRLETVVEAACSKWHDVAGRHVGAVIIGSNEDHIWRMRRALPGSIRHPGDCYVDRQDNEPIEVGYDPGQKLAIIYKPTLGETIRYSF